MLEKFFNVNQVAETQINLLYDKKIVNVTGKEDGSLIAFMQLPNGHVFAKTQAGWNNDQSIAAMKIYNENESIKKHVNKYIAAGYTPLFEYVSFDNRIVLKYNVKELRLIGIRNNTDGKYISASTLFIKDIPTVKTMQFESLDEIVNMLKDAEDIEGVVIEFDDGMMVKMKTEWYFNLHAIRTENIFREDYVIKNYLEQTLDDVLGELNPTDDADAFKFINKVTDAVNNWSNYIEKEVAKLVSLWNDSFYYGHWGKFATDKHKSTYFGLARTKIENDRLYPEKKVKYMLSFTTHLKDSRKIVETFNIK
jgi:T4 RnlA family RNA ligase